MTLAEIEEIHKKPAGLEMNRLILREIFEVSFSDDHKIWELPETQFSTDISAAFEVIKKVGEKFYTSINDDLGFWNVDFWSDKLDSWNPAGADTLPLAICRAALLTKVIVSGRE